MPRKKDKDLHATRRQQILDAAKRCFVAEGFHQTSMRQILDASGISAGGAYNYFASKADIVKGIVEEEATDIDFLEKQLTSSRNSLAGVAQLVEDVIGYTNHEDAVLSMEIYAEACRNPEIGVLTRGITTRLQSLISMAISHGQIAGVIAAEYTAEELTEWVVALYEGYIGRIAADPSLKPMAAARIAKRCVLHLLAKTT